MRSITRKHGVAACLLTALVATSVASAQDRKLTVKDVGHIADEALRAMLPPDTTLTGISVAKRGIAFDARGTLDAFGFKDTAVTSLVLTRSVLFATGSVTRDCSQVMPLPCAALGERAFVTISPLSVTPSRAHIRVTVAWATPVRIGADSSPPRRALLSWYSLTVYVVRTADGRWVYPKQTVSGVVG